jgi:cAMP-dependent protein kinase regulator
MSKGQVPKPITDNELNELRNLKKKVDYLKDKLLEKGEDDEEEEHSGSEDDDDEDVAEM